MAPDLQSHKRKASDEFHGGGQSASPKRAKTESNGEATTDAIVSKEQSMPETTSAPANTGIQERRTSQASESHLPTAPRESRSPTLPRKSSISQAPGPGTDRGRGRINDEEKKRGQRLFGGLLSTLSRKTDTSQQKKRQEIERRQQERAQAHKIEDDKRRAEKLAKLTHVRKIEQVNWDEQVVSFRLGNGLVMFKHANAGGQMNTRHANLLSLAKSLCTKAEPKIVRLILIARSFLVPC